MTNPDTSIAAPSDMIRITQGYSWFEYVPLAIRTAKPLPYDLQVEHALMGAMGECGELIDAYKKSRIYGKPLDKVNILEEAGDLAWYLALLCDTLRLNPGTFYDSRSRSDRPLTFGMLKALNKTLIMLGDPDNLEITHTAQSLVEDALMLLRNICQAVDSEFAYALFLNIKKLAARYGDKYSDQAALVRQLETERNVLEGKV